MEVERGDYKAVGAKRFPSSGSHKALESAFWKSFVTKKDIPQHFAGITSISFCPHPPFDFAVTSSTRVTIYDGVTCEVKKTITRFADVAYSGVFRSDGQLLAAGSEMGTIQVFKVNSGLNLRELKGHTRAVHWLRYPVHDKLHLLSAGDDKSVRWWDVASQAELLKLEEHTDYVRCGAPNPTASELWATGSYDHTVRLWDMRTNKSILKLQHGKPVEDVIFFPSGGLVATAGGTFVKIWDVLGGGRLLDVLGSHQKTVTSMHITSSIKACATSTKAAPHLLTTSLDGHVKVYDMDTFKVTHAAKYPAPILSLGMSESCMTMAVGTSSGLLFVRQRKNVKDGTDKPSEKPQIDGLQVGQVETRSERVLLPTNYRYFLRGSTEKASDGDFVVAHERKVRLIEHDRFLRKFQYKDALMASLKTSDPTVVIAVMEELISRCGLVSSISNLEPSNLELILSFLRKYMVIPKYSRLLLPFAHKLLDICGGDLGKSSSIRKQVGILKEKVAAEVCLQESLQVMQGLIQPLIHASVS